MLHPTSPVRTNATLAAFLAASEMARRFVPIGHKKQAARLSAFLIMDAGSVDESHTSRYRKAVSAICASGADDDQHVIPFKMRMRITQDNYRTRANLCHDVCISCCCTCGFQVSCYYEKSRLFQSVRLAFSKTAAQLECVCFTPTNNETRKLQSQ